MEFTIKHQDLINSISRHCDGDETYKGYKKELTRIGQTKLEDHYKTIGWDLKEDLPLNFKGDKNKDWDDIVKEFVLTLNWDDICDFCYDEADLIYKLILDGQDS